MGERELWHIRRVSPDEYRSIVPDRGIFFNEPAFTELNRGKVDEVFYLILMREDSARFGMIAGRMGTELRMPFSAPYAYPVSVLDDSKQEAIDAALEVFETYCGDCGIKSVRFILPPLFGTYGVASVQAAADLISLAISIPLMLKAYRMIKEAAEVG